MNKLINVKYLLTSTIIMMVVVSFYLTNKVNAEESVSPTTNTSPSVNKYSPPPIPGTVQEKIRSGMDNRLQNIKNNQETREEMVRNGKLPTTTLPKMIKEDQRFSSSSKMKIENRDKDRDGDKDREIRERLGSSTKLMIEARFSSTSPRLGDRLEKENRASTTRPFLKRDGYENEGKAMVEKILKERKDNLIKQLNVAIKNLTDLRKRIGSRIEKDRMAGKDLSSVSELLKIADAKLVIARDSVKAVQDYTPSTKEQLATTTTDSPTKLINLDQIRTLVDKSRAAIKDAHKALNDVVVAIAKLNGNNLPKNTPTNSSTATPSPTSTVPVSSTNQ